ncbi:caspase domain-containing protein [Phellopilus nigrolimitatus]|nr:caspase domain-containing protein [Phellopilus nigrolimitatus]
MPEPTTSSTGPTKTKKDRTASRKAKVKNGDTSEDTNDGPVPIPPRPKRRKKRQGDVAAPTATGRSHITKSRPANQKKEMVDATPLDAAPFRGIAKAGQNTADTTISRNNVQPGLSSDSPTIEKHNKREANAFSQTGTRRNEVEHSKKVTNRPVENRPAGGGVLHGLKTWFTGDKKPDKSNNSMNGEHSKNSEAKSPEKLKPAGHGITNKDLEASEQDTHEDQKHNSSELAQEYPALTSQKSMKNIKDKGKKPVKHEDFVDNSETWNPKESESKEKDMNRVSEARDKTNGRDKPDNTNPLRVIEADTQEADLPAQKSVKMKPSKKGDFIDDPSVVIQGSGKKEDAERVSQDSGVKKLSDLHTELEGSIHPNSTYHSSLDDPEVEPVQYCGTCGQPFPKDYKKHNKVNKVKHRSLHEDGPHHSDPPSDHYTGAHSAHEDKNPATDRNVHSDFEEGHVYSDRHLDSENDKITEAERNNGPIYDSDSNNPSDYAGEYPAGDRNYPNTDASMSDAEDTRALSGLDETGNHDISETQSVNEANSGKESYQSYPGMSNYEASRPDEHTEYQEKSEECINYAEDAPNDTSFGSNRSLSPVTDHDNNDLEDEQNSYSTNISVSHKGESFKDNDYSSNDEQGNHSYVMNKAVMAQTFLSHMEVKCMKMILKNQRMTNMTMTQTNLCPHKQQMTKETAMGLTDQTSKMMKSSKIMFMGQSQMKAFLLPGLEEYDRNGDIQNNYRELSSKDLPDHYCKKPSWKMQESDDEESKNIPYDMDNPDRKMKALLIGSNYSGQKHELKGCRDDVKNMYEYLKRNGFKHDNIDILMDMWEYEPPTRENIISHMEMLIAGAKPGDSLFLHYSGHGGQTKDKDEDELDGEDEGIYPVNYQISKPKGILVDDIMHDILVDKLPEGVHLTAIFDSCHSGSVLDLPYRLDLDGKITKMDPRKTRKDTEHLGRVILWSGCNDSQTSADTKIKGESVGAMSYAFIEASESHPDCTYDTLLEKIR